MFKIMTPAATNETFARAFNSRNLDNLLALYEPGAVHVGGVGVAPETGIDQIGGALSALLQIAGTMVSVNNFCIENGGIALLRADWKLVSPDGTVVASGSTAEVMRRQPDGSWLYIIDHAAGASAPPAA